MMILMLTIPVTITMVILFLIFFVVASKHEQFDDLETPSYTPLSDDENEWVKANSKNIFEEQA